MNTQTNVNANEMHAVVMLALSERLTAMRNVAANTGGDIEHACKGKTALSVDAVQVLIDCEKYDFAEWVKTAPTKSVKRCVKFLKGCVAREVEKDGIKTLVAGDATLGGNPVPKAVIHTARLLNRSELQYALIHHQITVNQESEELSTFTKGKSIRAAQQRQSKGTSNTQLSNSCGKHGFLQYLGIVTRDDKKSVLVDRSNAFYKRASAILASVKGAAPVGDESPV